MLKHSPPAGTESQTERELALARRISRQDQIRHVRARDEEHERDHAKKHEQARSYLMADERVHEGNDVDADVGIALRILRGNARGKKVRLGLRGAKVGPVPEAADDPEIAVVAVRFTHEGQIDLLLLVRRKPESGRKDADNRPRLFVRADRAANGVGASAELFLPRGVAQDCHWRRARHVIAGHERPAGRDRNAEHLEETGRDLDRSHELGPSSAGQCHSARRERRDGVKAGALQFPRFVIGVGGDVFPIAGLLVRRPDQHEAVGVREGQRAQQHRIHHAEDRRVDANAKAERQDGGHRERWTFPKDAHGKTEVLSQVVEDRYAAAIAVLFFDLLEPAEADERIAPRGLRRHTGAEIVVDVQLQMTLELRLQIAFVPAGPDHRSQSPHPHAHVPHDDDSGEKNRAMMSVVRSQSRASF